MGQVPLEVEVTAWFLNPVSGFGHEPLFVNSKQVLSGFFVILFAVVGLAKTASAYPPHSALGCLFGSFDLFTHCLACVTHLVQGKGRYPSISSDALGVAVFALNFRHDFVLAGVVADFKGVDIWC